MPNIPNPNNNFIPKKGQVIRIIGACNATSLNQLALIVDVDDNYAATMSIYETGDKTRYKSIAYSGGELGGLEPVTEQEAETFLKLLKEQEAEENKKT